MKLWVDDVRPAPKGYVWCNSVNDAINTIKLREARIENILQRYTPSEIRMKDLSIQVIDIDHDAGEYSQYESSWRGKYEKNYPEKWMDGGKVKWKVCLFL